MRAGRTELMVWWAKQARDNQVELLLLVQPWRTVQMIWLSETPVVSPPEGNQQENAHLVQQQQTSSECKALIGRTYPFHVLPEIILKAQHKMILYWLDKLLTCLSRLIMGPLQMIIVYNHDSFITSNLCLSVWLCVWFQNNSKSYVQQRRWWAKEQMITFWWSSGFWRDFDYSKIIGKD